ncbi:MAG: hypothetical protein RLZZ292_1267 [Bacteroidota bacterium]
MKIILRLNNWLKQHSDKPKLFLQKIKENPRKATLFFVIFLAYFFCLPRPLFHDPTSMVIEDNKGGLLGARIAADGQWRFPYRSDTPDKYAKCLIAFEDKRFYYHWGVDPISIVRAFGQNIRKMGVASGGSTITMQVVRMARKGQARTLWQKLVEVIWATRLEFRSSKKEILALYSSNAPFGGNVVGIDAASWRYFGKNPSLLSWAEAATLAVLPNSPALIHPGRNRNNLLEKRNRLLIRLLEEKTIDKTTCELAQEEPLPDKPLDLPRLAPHLLDRAFTENFKGKRGEITRLRTTIDANLQAQVNDILKNHHVFFKSNSIHNLAAMVLDVETGNVLAYVGNVEGAGEEHGEQVDIIRAPRSSGSIFKPILYALGQQEGIFSPTMLISDIPMHLGGYSPKNYYETYDGAVTIKRALVRSLNVPFVKMTGMYGLERFHYWLQRLGLKTVNRPAEYYGMPLILGGAETCLWDITNLYAGMARTVNHFPMLDSRYAPNDFRSPNYIFGKKFDLPSRFSRLNEPPLLSASACYLTFDAMQNVERPTGSGDWQLFQSSKRVAWKTGTSFGFRDAWAVGVTPRYAVGVWVGNADGEGRPDLIGVQAAAPVLFDIFNILPSNDWFSAPYDEMAAMPLCRQSGYRPNQYCNEIDTVWVTKNGANIPPCPYHQILHLDASSRYQVTDACENPSNMQHLPWFVLPTVEEFYYKSKNPNYTSPPPYRDDCNVANTTSNTVMQLIYPRQFSKIYVPIDLDGKPSRTVFQAAHREAGRTIHWNIDNQFIASTKDFHNIEAQPSVGKHLLVLVDEKGNRLEQAFEIIAR